MNLIWLVMGCNKGTRETKKKQQNEENGTNDCNTVPYEPVEDDTSLAAPLLYQCWGYFQKWFDFFLGRCYVESFGYIHSFLLLSEVVDIFTKCNEYADPLPRRVSQLTS